MPSTQHDALVWLSGSAYDVIFDMARSVIHDLAGLATLAEETSSWPYRHDRDLTGFIDGSENPTLLDAPAAALLPEGVPYGRVEEHGTMFVGFSADQKRLSSMLESMAGLVTGTRDALTRFSQPLTGSYYLFCALRQGFCAAYGKAAMASQVAHSIPGFGLRGVFLNSVFPTGADYRKATICGVEGSAIAT